MSSRKQIELWIEKYLKGEISEDEKDRLNEWYEYLPDTEIIWTDENVNNSQDLKNKIWIAINQKIHNKKVRRKIKIRKLLLKAAAIIILFIGIKELYKNTKTLTNKPAKNILADVKPGITKALLILSNGKKVLLDSIHSINTKKDSIYLIDKNGDKEYFANKELEGYNTLITQRGEASPQITLSDGTKVWVNSASELHFPINFNGTTREVFLTGEAYFEVAKDHSHPFIVNIGRSKIKVTGTHFDVMAYQDDPYCATLLEGAITIINDGNTVNLIPGEQAEINSIGKVIVKKVDTNQSIAWLYNQLSMDGIGVSAFMRKVSRWYNVDIEYKGVLPTFNFSGSLDKNVPLSQVLSALNANGIKCVLQNHTVIIFGK